MFVNPVCPHCSSSKLHEMTPDKLNIVDKRDSDLTRNILLCEDCCAYSVYDVYHRKAISFSEVKKRLHKAYETVYITEPDYDLGISE